MCAAQTATVAGIEALVLEPDPSTALPADEGARLVDDPSAAVVGSSLVAFAGGVSSLHRQDVMHSLLLAQLAANAKAHRHIEPTAWFRAYATVLQQTAWVIASSVIAERYLSEVSRFPVSTVVQAVFRDMLFHEELALITATMSAFRADLSGASQVVFECPSHSDGIGSFQVALATEDDGVLSMRIAQVSFTAAEHVPRLFLHEFTEASEFRVGYLDLTQNEQVYARLRAAIARKVGSRLPRFVAVLPLH